MLSYRHAFHAGNFADVLKHIVLIEILEYLLKKDKPFHFIDTHAGAGLYDLRSGQANKTAEYLDGIARLTPAEWPELSSLFDVVSAFNPDGGLNSYPGSPLIAQYFLRDCDREWLFEWHPSDYVLLQAQIRQDKRIRAQNEDGFVGMLSLLPPITRRGLVLIDPPYEVKSDYAQVFESLDKAYRKFSTGIYALWYPVVDRKRIEDLMQRFSTSAIRNIQVFELAVSPDSDERGMTGAGMLVINPPWTLMNHMQQILPRLAKLFGSTGSFYKAEQLVPE
ncbi:MAG: 23S rRNA (adenine(2030)-N(6))-methyltransferase RlmJ [Gammaproteobacteria bacterium]|nr:23S rRNA (adenine(2030)-N(6))-methyltransferase RlmJ [Gammaproteobacteria bacterium]